VEFRFKSAFAAGVLSILLIFTMLSGIGASAMAFDAVDGIRIEKHDDLCSMNSSTSEIPFADTRIMSASGADIFGGNKLFYAPVYFAAMVRSVVSFAGLIKPIAVSDMHAEFLVRLLI